MVLDKTKRIPLLHLAHCAKYPGLKLCCLLIISLFTMPVVGEEILVITHQDTPVSNLSKIEVTSLYFGISQNKRGLTPFDLHDKKLRQSFCRRVTGLSLASIRAKRAEQVFTGRGRPPAMLTLEQVNQVFSEKSGS